LQVVATTTIVGDVVRQVAGDLVVLQVLLPAGTDPHAFEPRPQDAALLADADLVFASGAGLEEFLQPLLQNAGIEGRTVELSAGIALLPFAGDEHASTESQFDPHTWMDPNNVIVWVKNASAALSAADPDHAGEYETNANLYIQSLQELDAWLAQQVNRLPPERRRLVLDHYTLGYFASAYGFEIVGERVSSISTNAQTSAQELAALEDQIRALDVSAILVSQTVNPALAEQVAQDTGIQMVQIYTGSLGPPGGPAATYLDMMRYNGSRIVEALTP
jgi:ABC-type Zn uptake system ZnuABC Zn-binding protein ZnuA